MNLVNRYLLDNNYDNFSAQAAGIWIGHGLSGLLGGAGGLAGGLKLSENKMQGLLEEASKEGMMKGGIAATLGGVGGLVLAKMLKDKYKNKYGHTSYSQALFNERLSEAFSKKEERQQKKYDNKNAKIAEYNNYVYMDQNGMTDEIPRRIRNKIAFRAMFGKVGPKKFFRPEEKTTTIYTNK